jgi:hypothetical protein
MISQGLFVFLCKSDAYSTLFHFSGNVPVRGSDFDTIRALVQVSSHTFSISSPLVLELVQLVRYSKSEIGSYTLITASLGKDIKHLLKDLTQVKNIGFFITSNTELRPFYFDVLQD